MIYLCTKQQELIQSDLYSIIDEHEALEIVNGWNIIQFDVETTGRDAHLCNLLSIQLGNDLADIRIVVDCSTVDVLIFKEVLETKRLIGHNLKFDLQFLYNYGIIPQKIYDTMIVEQLLFLGYPAGVKMYSLKAVAWDRLKVDIDKSIRGDIIWKGLSPDVVVYAAGDVTYLEQIMRSQIMDCQSKDCMKAAELECNAVPAMAYLEWCGIMLDREKWTAKMKNDKTALHQRKEALDNFVTSNPQLSDYYYVDTQGDLFSGFDLTPKCDVNWDSSQQVIKVAKTLGFDTTVQDKKTGENKDSVLEKVIKAQKGINDEFLKLYFDYRESSKVCSTYGQGHLNAINPRTGRIHTTFKQIGASSGRMSCGSNQANTDLAKELHIAPSSCTYPNLQQLPADEPTRSAFVAPKGNLMVSADFSAEESRLGADIYQDKEFIKEFTEGSGDTHAMFAWIVYNKECRALGCTGPQDVKRLAPKQRKAVKGYEFGWMFGAAAPTLAQTAGCTVEEAQSVIDRLERGFSGVSDFAKRGSKFVREHGYILISKHTGHKMYWWDWDKWRKRQASFTPEFWEEYRQHHKGSGDAIAQEVREHFQAASKYDRMARNSPCQGTGAIIMKEAITQLFRWIILNNYFNKVHLCCCVHDEIVCDFPEELNEFPNILESIMEGAAAKYCKTLPIPAEAEVDVCWRH